MSKIERLTPEQARELVPFREEMLARALSTTTIDRAAACAAVDRLYEAGGLARPEIKLVFTSPMLCLLARGVLRGLPELGDQLGGQLGGQLWDQLRGQLGDQLGDQLWDQLGDQLWDQFVDQLWDQLRGQLGDQLRGQLWDQLGKTNLFESVYFAGAWDAFWIAFYEFGRRIGAKFKASSERHFNAYKDFSDACGVSFLYPKIAFISDRPERMSFDPARRLHAEDGPALRYRDGYSIYAWKGMRIDPRWIEKRHEITTRHITAESNAERRRVLMEIYAHVHGPGRIIADMNARLIAEDESHGRPRKLYEISGNRFLHVINGSLDPDGTRREFLLGAEPNARTPHEAVASSYGRPAAKYREAVRT